MLLKKARLCAYSLTLSATVAACASPQGSGSTSAESSEAPQHVVDVSRPKTYQSLAEVQKDSSLQIEGVANDRQIETISGMQFAVTNVRVTKLLKSSDSIKIGQQVRVRQTVATATGAEGMDGELLQKGSSYILMLQPFWLDSPDKPVKNEYIITGGQGSWVSEGSQTFSQSQSNTLPKSVADAGNSVVAK